MTLSGTFVQLDVASGQNQRKTPDTQRFAKERPILTVGRCTIAKTEAILT